MRVLELLIGGMLLVALAHATETRFLTFAVFFLLGSIGAMVGSTRSIRPEWHEEQHWASRIRPNITRVCPTAALFATTLTVTGRRILVATQLPDSVGTIICLAGDVALAYLVAFVIGSIVYAPRSRRRS